MKQVLFTFTRSKLPLFVLALQAEEDVMLMAAVNRWACWAPEAAGAAATAGAGFLITSIPCFIPQLLVYLLLLNPAAAAMAPEIAAVSGG